jgi:hypothetical protein
MPELEAGPQAHSCAYVTYGDALRIRAAMSAVLGVADPCRAADELVARANRGGPEAAVGWIAWRNSLPAGAGAPPEGD